MCKVIAALYIQNSLRSVFIQEYLKERQEEDVRFIHRKRETKLPFN